MIWVPTLIALIPATLLNSQAMFILTFSALMVICDAVTTLCVYRIALTVWGNQRRAFTAGVLYTTMFSAAYYTIGEYTAFSIMIFMVGIMFTVDNKEKVNGYISGILGFFTKVYPVILLPFFVLYNSNKSTLKDELVSCGKIAGAAALILLVPFVLINPTNALDTYKFNMTAGVAEAALYTLHSWLHTVLGLPITLDMLGFIGKLTIGIVVAALLYVLYNTKNKTPALLLKLILAALFVIVMAAQFHSPNYDMWYIPIICIFAIDDIRKIILLYITQAINFVIFPLTFYSLWTNTTYTPAALTPNWYMALFIFTAQAITLIVLVWLIVNPVEIYRKFRGEQNV